MRPSAVIPIDARVVTVAPEVVEIELSHLRVTALAWGPKRGRLILCLHGFPDSAWSWRRLAPSLANRGFRVVAPFTRGYAPSRLPADDDYTVGALMSDAVELHRVLDGGRDAVLIGHDWGAFTCNAVAAWPASPFSHHVSMSVPPVASIAPRRGALRALLRILPQQSRMSWYVMFFQLPVLPERVVQRLVAKLWRDWSPGFEGADDVINALAAMPTTAHRVAAISYYRCLARNSTPAAAYAEPHRFRFGVPRLPFLYLHGTTDHALHPGFVDVAATALPEGSVVEMIERAGHFLQIEQPGAVADAILRFLGTPS